MCQSDLTNTRKTIYINQKCYDITDFVKRHPGGNVLLYYEGQDATMVYKEMHRRSKKSDAFLNSLPVLDNPPVLVQKESNSNMQVDFEQWRTSLEERGFFKPNLQHVGYRLLELCGIYILATWFMGHHNSISTCIGVLLYGLFGGRCGWVQHEAGHRSFTGDILVDTWIQKAAIGFGLLTSGPMWNHMHNRHHAATQKLEYDLDLDTMPFVLFNGHAYKENKLVSKWWLRFQAYTFLPATSGLFVMLFWIFYLHPRKIIRDEDYVQGFFTLCGHIIRPLVIYSTWNGSFLQSYGLHMLTMYLAGIYLFGHFSTSHTFMPVVSQFENPSWIEYSLNHTVDIDTQNPWVCWFMGYLNCQCIHHLFPQMPQYRQPEVSKELALFAKKWDLQYHEISYMDAWYRTFQNMDEVGKQVQEKGIKTD
jgi:acyl-CoA 6-desaturase (Delta-6 desaturase)